MTKKIINIILNILTIIIAYILQIFVFNNINFYGVKANLPLMVIAIISILVIDNKKQIYTYGIICGVFSDFLFSDIIGKYLVINIFVVTILSSIKTTYKQDSKFSVIIFSVVATVIFESILLIFNLFVKKEFVNIYALFWNMFKQCIINVFFAYFVYFIMKRVLKKE